jgi:electron transfer flavoprotein beta subunit
MSNEESLNMKILVPVKRVVDANAHVRVKPDGSGIDVSGIRMSINPLDEIAVEEAVRLKEKSSATEMVCVSIGPAEAAEALRSAFAIVTAQGDLEPLAEAKILKSIIEEETTMNWTTPSIAEIAVGLEINAYAGAELNQDPRSWS